MKSLPPLNPVRKARKKTRLWKRLLLAGVVLTSALGVGTGVAVMVVYQKLPDVKQLEDYTLPQATEIYTESGKLLTRLSSEGRYDPVPLSDLPQHVQDAIISAEDRRFWQHEGVDFLGLGRAIFINLSKRKAVMGASTITQQLIKNLFLSSEQTAKRKISEALLAFQLERNYSKQQILEMYMNLVFLGHNVYGVEAASQIYFGKSARHITIAEAALLAGIIRSPEYLSPYHRPKDANKLKEIVLNQMEKDQRITPEQKQQALAQKIRLVGLRTSYPHPYFLDYVMYVLRRDFGDVPFRVGGWKVYTTLNPAMQTHAESLLQADLPRLQRSGASQAAMVSLEPKTGYVRALVGGVSYRLSQFNRAFQAQRQVGSTFKPFVYLAGFENGKDLQTTYEDTATSFGGYRPRNFDHRYHGKVSLLNSLTYSYNIPTIKLAQDVGMDRVVEVAQRAGVASPIAEDLSAAIGSSEMNLLELTAAYGAFANGGYRVTPTPILKIIDQDGIVIRDYIPNQRQVFDSRAVGMLNSALKNVITTGSGKAANIGRPAAGKTGTTDRAFDTWFVGYVPQLVTGIWAGNDQPSATRGGGGTMCAPLWRSFMLRAVMGLPIEDFAGFMPASPSPSGSASGSADPSASPSGDISASPSNSIVEISSTPVPAATPVQTPRPLQTPADLPSQTPLPLPSQEDLPVVEESAVLDMTVPEGN